MKYNVAPLALALALSVVPLPAAEERVFEGVNLDTLKQTQQLKEMSEIYERDPANGRYRLRRAAVQLPLGAAWLTFNPGRRAFFLNKVPGENAATYFGPIAGDPFEEQFVPYCLHKRPVEATELHESAIGKPALVLEEHKRQMERPIQAYPASLSMSSL